MGYKRWKLISRDRKKILNVVWSDKEKRLYILFPLFSIYIYMMKRRKIKNEKILDAK